MLKNKEWVMSFFFRLSHTLLTRWVTRPWQAALTCAFFTHRNSNAHYSIKHTYIYCICKNIYTSNSQLHGLVKCVILTACGHVLTHTHTHTQLTFICTHESINLANAHVCKCTNHTWETWIYGWSMNRLWIFRPATKRTKKLNEKK